MTSLERDIKDLEVVNTSIRISLCNFPIKKFPENEVQIRYDTIRNFLILMENEVSDGIREWKKQL